MPPKVKYQKTEILNAAVELVRQKGISTLSARELAECMGCSTQPIFSCYSSMQELRAAIYGYAKELYSQYINDGLREPIPFLGVGKQYIRFAGDERELYKLLFLTKPDGVCGGANEALCMSQQLVREHIMRIYDMDANTADKYFRNVWFAAFSYATMIVVDECTLTDDEIFEIFSELSLAVCKAYKEIPGLAEGTCDKDSVFRSIIKKQ